jgi:hypothetical protein
MQRPSDLGSGQAINDRPFSTRFTRLPAAAEGEMQAKETFLQYS